MYEEMLIQKGWECPKCGRVYSPSVDMCKYCVDDVTFGIQTDYSIKGVDLSEEALEDIYRRRQHKHVMEDVEAYIKSYPEELKLNKADINIIAERYVYGGDHDCSLSYWDNIENLINNYKN